MKLGLVLLGLLILASLPYGKPSPIEKLAELKGIESEMLKVPFPNYTFSFRDFELPAVPFGMGITFAFGYFLMKMLRWRSCTS
jgi:hypothetical protein